MSTCCPVRVEPLTGPGPVLQTGRQTKHSGFRNFNNNDSSTVKTRLYTSAFMLQFLGHQEHSVFYSVSMTWTDWLTVSTDRGVTVLVRTAVVPGLYLYRPTLQEIREHTEK